MRHSISVIGVVVLASVIAACASTSSTPAATVAPDRHAVRRAGSRGHGGNRICNPEQRSFHHSRAAGSPDRRRHGRHDPTTICPDPYGASCNQYKVTWTEANPEGVTINVYVVTECLSKPHCVAATTTIPAADLVLVGTVTASTGAAAFVVGDGESQGDGWLSGSGGAVVRLCGCHPGQDHRRTFSLRGRLVFVAATPTRRRLVPETAPVGGPAK